MKTSKREQLYWFAIVMGSMLLLSNLLEKQGIGLFCAYRESGEKILCILGDTTEGKP